MGHDRLQPLTPCPARTRLPPHASGVDTGEIAYSTLASSSRQVAPDSFGNAVERPGASR